MIPEIRFKRPTPSADRSSNWFRVQWRDFVIDTGGLLGVIAGFVLAFTVLAAVPVIVHFATMW